jgi:ferredoxin--NADP+ reductase
MLEDLPELDGAYEQYRSPDAAEALVLARKPDYVSHAGWKKINAHETANGQAQGRPRVKLTTIAEMLAIGNGL